MRRVPTPAEAIPRSAPGARGAVAAFCLAFLLTYQDVLARLLRDWATDDNYSHGFLVVPLAAFLARARLPRLRQMPAEPSPMGFALVIGSLGVLVAGFLGAELFLTRVSMIGVLVGTVLFVLGWRHLSVLAFPLSLLLLTIPIPALIFNEVAFPLQVLASRFGETVLAATGVPVLREGNVIVLATTTLEVAEACSGIRSLVSLLTLAILYGYFSDERSWVRVTSAALTVPIAIAANGLRVAGTGLAAHRYGAKAAEGFFHTFSGWLVFAAAFVMLFGVMRVLARIVPPAGIEPCRS
jgi:exosortase